MACLLVGSDFLTVGGIYVAKFCSVSLFVVLSSNHEMVFYAAWNTLPINPQLNLSPFQMVEFLYYILLEMNREMSNLINNFIYHLSIVPLHYTHLRQLIILTITDVLVMTHTQRLISVSPSLLQSRLRSMVSFYAPRMLSIRPLDETHSMTVLCNDLTLLYLSPFNFLTLILLTWRIW